MYWVSFMSSYPTSVKRRSTRRRVIEWEGEVVSPPNATGHKLRARFPAGAASGTAIIRAGRARFW